MPDGLFKTFVQDLKPFRYFLGRVAADIKQMENISSVMIDHYSDSRRQSFIATLENLRT